ncbi:MAG TPA: hypothetical protein VIS74_08200 [Chthoniobacterales bacterium]
MNPPRLTPPRPEEVVRLENIPQGSPHFFPYSTEQRMVSLTEGELRHFLKKGALSANDAHTTDALRDLAPFSLPNHINRTEFPDLEAWAARNKPNLALFLVCAGAFSTRDGTVYFWRKLNDRVLYLATQKASCYLVLPKTKDGQ